MFIGFASSFACKKRGQKKRPAWVAPAPNSGAGDPSASLLLKNYPLLSEYQAGGIKLPTVLAWKMDGFRDMHFGNGAKSLTGFPHLAESGDSAKCELKSG
jgi:hypothetical protein